MNIRKIIKEELNSVFNEDSNGIVGLDILNHFPFSELPENRLDGDWQKGVPGWGKVFIPGLNAVDAEQQVVSKDDFTYREVEGPKMVHKYDGYIENFKKMFGEEPVFSINPSADWYNKVKIINPKFKQWRESGIKNKSISGGFDE